MRTLLVTPTEFSEQSIIGGGERYVAEFAQAVGNVHDVRVLSFSGCATKVEYPGSKPFQSIRARGWRIDKEDPLGRVGPALARQAQWSEAIHCFQYPTPSADASLLLGAALRKPVFITPLGGGSRWTPGAALGVARNAAAMLHISAFSAENYADQPTPHVVIGGGVDAERFVPIPNPQREAFLFVGRILPHKGIDVLISALPAGGRLLIVGTEYDKAYAARLRALAAGKDVRFVGHVDDSLLIELYQNAVTLVLPSVQRPSNGAFTPIPELLGQVLLEAMSCGTAVICSNVGPLPAVVRHGVDGFVVPQNDVDALAQRMTDLACDPGLVSQLGKSARQRVLKDFAWADVASRALKAYETNGIRPFSVAAGRRRSRGTPDEATGTGRACRRRPGPNYFALKKADDAGGGPP